MDKIDGYLEVGTNDKREVVINQFEVRADENGTHFLAFSPLQARHLAELLLKKADEAEGTSRLDDSNLYYVSFDTKTYPGKLAAVRIRLDTCVIADMNIPLPINLCEHPLYRDLQNYVDGNRI